MTPDQINAVYEFVGALLICLSIRRLAIDGEVKGVSLWPVTFFATWGFWNLFYYPYLSQWWSFAGGLLMVTTNSIWLLQMAYFIWVAPPKHLRVTAPVTNPRCPHGFHDWDNCPDCCH